MNKSIETVLIIMMLSSVIVLLLETLGQKANRDFIEKPHIKLLSNTAILASLIIIIFELNQQRFLNRAPQLFFESIAAAFILINTFISIYLSNKTKALIRSDNLHFLLLSSSTIAIACIWTEYASIKLLAATGWLLLMATLSIKTTQGGKKAEVGLKLSFSAFIFFLSYILAIYFLSNSSLQMPISSIQIDSDVGLIGVLLLVVSGMSIAGISPFSFAHVDSADSSDLSIAFLLSSNAMIIGSEQFIDAKNILMRSGNNFSIHQEPIAYMLAIGLFITWMRALDQSKIRRTATYIASSMSPLFCLAILFGTSLLLPRLIYLLALFSFVTLALFALFGSMAFMDPVYKTWQTWEDIAGFGKKNRLPSLYFLIAIGSIAGIPGTLGYFVKLSLIAPMKDSYFFSSVIFISIAMGAACTMRIFVFLFSKQSRSPYNHHIERAPISLMLTSIVLIVLGFFPFVR